MSKVDPVLCTIDNIPMETLVEGKLPTIQNTQGWIDEERRKKEHYEFLNSMVNMFKKHENP